MYSVFAEVGKAECLECGLPPNELSAIRFMRDPRCPDAAEVGETWFEVNCSSSSMLCDCQPCCILTKAYESRVFS